MHPSLSAAWFFCSLSSVIAIGGSRKMPYEGAQNYWPLEKKTSAMTVPDAISGATGNVHKAKFIKNIGITGAVSFSGSLEWIDFPTGQFETACIENPESCQFGFTIAFWIRFKAGKYILATGAFTNSSQGTGIRITHENGLYCATVCTQTDVWQVSAKAYNTSWCHVVIRWSPLHGLQMFLNGKSVASDIEGKTQRIQPSSFSKTLTIARPPRLTQKGFGKFDMAHLAVWQDHLTNAQISQLGDLVLDGNDNNQYQCVSKNVSCTNNPCSESCQLKYLDAVCLNIRHQYCPEIFKDKTTVASNTTKWRTQSATSVKHLKKDVNFTPTALSTKRPSRNSDASGQDNGFTTISPIQKLGKIYMDTTHYIGLKGGKLDDLKGNSKVSMPVRPRIFATKQLGEAVSLNGRQDCITIKDMKIRCIKNPHLCKDTGFSFALWLRNHSAKKQYIAYSITPHKGSVTGFMIRHKQNGEYLTVTVRARKRQWEAVIHRMPYHTRWWHLSITWDKQSGIALFINGNFVMQRSYAEDISKGGKSMDSSLASDSDDIVIGCPNSTTGFIKSLNNFGKFDFAHLAIWNKVLSQLDIRRAYQASIIETKESKACCGQKYGHDCTTFPCKISKACEVHWGNDNCLCKERLRPVGRCLVETPLKSCANSRKYKCEKLASQAGYCYYYQAEMEEHCPASCNLCDGPYRKAAHYFNIHSNHLSDNFASSTQPVFPTKLNIKQTEQLGDVIALNSQDYYVQIKGFKRECFTEPNVCSEGLSVAFWLRMTDGKYIIAGGRYRDEPRGSGFVVLHDSNSSKFRIEVATPNKKWTAIIHKIPFTKQWFHLVFTWSLNTGLRVSINGQFLLQDAGARERKYSLRSVYENNGILIGGKDPSNGKIRNVDFEIGHVAIWDYALDSWAIQQAYKESIKKNALSLQCCRKLSASKCVSNACYKFRAPELCEAFFNEKKCLCPNTRVREKCKIHKFKGECKDKRTDCKQLASQNGYCDYYEQEMEQLCPVSCKFCSLATKGNRDGGRTSSKMSREVLVFALIGCAAGIILLFLISLYSWKVYRRKKWMKWSTYFVTVIPRDQSDGRLQGKDELEQLN